MSDVNAQKDPEQQTDPVDPKPGDTVAYESYKRLLGQKKNATAENENLKKIIEELKQANQSKEAEEATRKNDFQKLLEMEKKRAEELAAKHKEIEDKYLQQQNEIIQTRKLKSVLSSLDGKIDEQYFGLIDLDRVQVDPDTGEVDKVSVQNFVKDFEKSYSLIIKKGQKNPAMPNAAPSSASKKLTYEQWKALPYKEKLARQSDVEF